MCGCQNRVSGMKRNYKKILQKKASVSAQDVGVAAVGGLVSLALNGLVSKATANMNEDMRANVAKILPLAKVGVGGYLFLNSNDRMLQFAGLGMAGTGVIESASKWAPQYFSISGTDDDDLFSLLGSADPSLLISLDPGGSMEDSELESDNILGTEEYQEVPVL